MDEETTDSLIPYDEIVQEALRAVVGRATIIFTSPSRPGRRVSTFRATLLNASPMK